MTRIMKTFMFNFNVRINKFKFKFYLKFVKLSKYIRDKMLKRNIITFIIRFVRILYVL